MKIKIKKIKKNKLIPRKIEFEFKLSSKKSQHSIMTYFPEPAWDTIKTFLLLDINEYKARKMISDILARLENEDSLEYKLEKWNKMSYKELSREVPTANRKGGKKAMINYLVERHECNERFRILERKGLVRSET